MKKKISALWMSAGICLAVISLVLAVFMGKRTPVLAVCSGILTGFLLLWAVRIMREYRMYHRIVHEILGEISRDDFLDQTEKNTKSPVVEEVIELLTEKIHKRYGDLLATKQMEYSILQSQINPHFLYNTLEAIRSQAVIDRYDNLAEMVETLSRYYRYCVSNKKNFVLLEEELKNIQNYFKIQQFRFEGRFQLALSVMDQTLYKAVIPKMTLQPLVENAVFHGLEQKKQGGIVQIKIYRSDTDIHIFVSDNGCGMPFEKVVEINHSMIHKQDLIQNHSGRTGIAMVNVNSRIKMQYGEEYGVRVYSTEGMGTDVEVSLPYRNIEESGDIL